MTRGSDRGYGYRENLGVSGICSRDEESGEQRFLELPYFVPPSYLPRHLLSIPSWAEVCSSCRGVVLCRVSGCDYYVSNPYRGDLCRPLPTLPRPHPLKTPAVLAIDFQKPQFPVLHVVCAVREGAQGFYTFDTYSSRTHAWRHNRGINLQRCDPKADTGVSCGRFAYWLTRIPLLAIRYDIKKDTVTFLSLTEPVPQEVLWYETTRMQLGRVGDCLGLAVVNEAESRVELHILQGYDQWNPPRFLEMRICEDVNWDQIKRLEKRVDDLVCREMPKLIRFESFKMEVLLWVDGQVLVWEGNEFDPSRWQLVLCDFDTEVHVPNGIAHVFTSLFP